jgi:hypothetical protein
LRNAILRAAELLRLDRSLKHRLHTRARQHRLLYRQPVLDGMRDQLDHEMEELRRLVLLNGRALAAALKVAQAIADAQADKDKIDVDLMLMRAVTMLTRSAR